MGMTHHLPLFSALLLATACAQAAPPLDVASEGSSLLYNCPMGNADADKNGYPDACDKPLWSDERVFTMQPDFEWDPQARGKLDLYFTTGYLKTAGAAAGGFDSARNAFEDVSEMADFSTQPEGLAKRGADWLLSNANATDVWVQPQVGDRVMHGTNVSIESIRGKHAVHFVQTITGYGYDAATNPLGLKGSWAIFGY